ncbi:hypothetical protein EJB05_18815 [Eragrostis curvula]|uniref:Cysteine-rich transmembrane domain-containing protein n=1 Tax=Eragrostis curvula TaxID=38414 RepID=A0A5J9VKC7_9POAL|nr:hypothetical protein EJB05_18815 [Eragrostis curvula]
MENNSNNQPAPPPGYPTAAGAEQPAGGRKSRRGSTKARGEKGFIEGCIAALCCCWICEMCCD